MVKENAGNIILDTLYTSAGLGRLSKRMDIPHERPAIERGWKALYPTSASYPTFIDAIRGPRSDIVDGRHAFDSVFEGGGRRLLLL